MVDYQKIPLVFNVNKPPGPSSFSIVYHYRKNLDYDFGKIGHFGTLDPFAEGVLLVGVQGAQKLNDYIHELLPKTYEAVGIFGGKTDTGDLTSQITEEKHIDENFFKISREEMEKKLREHFLGEYWQAPHAVSASKFQGKRLYKYALKGKMIEKEKVKREILDLKILSYNYPEMHFSVTVSSGTYVRSLFEEIAQIFGGHGALKTLKRTAIGDNNILHAMTEKDWPKKGELFDLNKWGKPLDQVLVLNKVLLNQVQTKKYIQGHRYLFGDVTFVHEKKPVSSENILWVYSYDETLLGLAREVEGELHAIFNLTLAISLFS